MTAWVSTTPGSSRAPGSRMWHGAWNCCFRVRIPSPWRRVTPKELSSLELSGGELTHTVVIVDDEPPARAKLLRFLAPLPEFQVVAQADTVESAVAEITARKPDVVYLDIQLGAHSGFDVLEAIRGAESPHIVFTTAYSEYAVRAFDVQALDYLLKPYDRARFLRSIERVKSGIGGSRSRRSGRTRAPCDRGHAGPCGADQANPDTRSSAGLLHSGR